MARDARSRKVGTVTEDCFASLVRLYLQSEKFTAYSKGTQVLWGGELRFAARPDTLGGVSIQEMRPAVVQRFLDALDGRPGKQAAAYAALKQLEKWAIVREYLPRSIMLGVETNRPQGGHVPWSDADVELGINHARSDVARAIMLGANTGQRCSDLVRMCPTDVETFDGIDGINVTQKKTGRQVWVPITSELATAMAAWPRLPGPYLRRLDGRPWNPMALGKAWDAQKRRNPALAVLNEKGLVLHGLRGTACVRLRRAGATAEQIADMVGMSKPMVERYCRFSIQRENAAAAVYRLEKTFGERRELYGPKSRKNDG